MNRLESVPLFQSISPQLLEDIWHSGKVVKFEKNTNCFRAKEKNDCIYILLEGVASIYNLTHCGKRKTIFCLGKGELLNDCITPQIVLSVNCSTMVRSEIFVIRATVLERFMASNFELVQALMREMERKVWRMGHQLKNTMGSIYMERKLAAKLWKLGRDFGKEDEKGLYIDIPLSITELADFLGAPRETTSRIFKLLSSYHLVEMEHKRIYILSPEAMATFYKKGIVPQAE